ncbi:MAG: 6-carboxytetrahydropterin synthase QueD [Candidatus Acidiferrales bacterium]
MWDSKERAEKMYEISVDESFAAGHYLRGYKGKCENQHGHNYRVRVTMEGRELDSTGLLYDFVHLKHVIQSVIHSLDHRNLNDLAPFDKVNPSAENIAKYIYDETAKQMRKSANGAAISGITVWETETSAATFRP